MVQDDSQKFRWAHIILAALVVSLSATAFGQNPPPEQQPAKRVDLNEVFARTYSELIRGNEQDLKQHQQLATRHLKAAEAMKAKRESDARINEQIALARLYQRLASLNQAILKGLERGSTGDDVRRPMLELIKTERQLRELTGERTTRDWLTLQEVDVLRKRKVRYQTPAPGVLPFDRRHWKGTGR